MESPSLLLLDFVNDPFAHAEAIDPIQTDKIATPSFHHKLRNRNRARNPNRIPSRPELPRRAPKIRPLHIAR
jgi:hypothetical protein